MIKLIKLRDPDNEFDTTDVEFTISIKDITVNELVEAFNDFLKACTYGAQVEVVETVEENVCKSE